MALFEVPGWSIPEAPVSLSSSNSRKRKRPADAEAEVPTSSTKLHSAVKNVEKLMASLEDNGEATSKTQKNRRQRKGRDREEGEQKRKEFAREARPNKQKGERKREGNGTGKKHAEMGTPESSAKKTNATPTKKPKKDKGKDEKSQPPADSQPATSSANGSSRAQGKKKAEGLTSLQADMKNSLDGAKFRWINETLYKSDSSSAHEMMRDNPSVFSEYHTGFRHQVQSWPDNPVSHYISSLSSRPAGTLIVDLGCGDAALAKALVPKGLAVISYDLVSDGAFVVEADVCARVPLPGGEGDDDESGDGRAQVVDVVVCALSLMSTNWVGCVREAWRVLKLKGELKIAEVTSRFTDMEAFVSVVSAVGFKLKSKDDSNTHFILFEFVKVARSNKTDKEWQKLMERGSILKPCEYKRR
ncbi:methyltransferase-domain-containing protein [Irpex lacteus]|nr:methyltransferase-domain-containing protein [Irpex lacteus]